MAVAADGSGEPRRLVATQAQETYGRLSPDGKWLAYLSDESGTRQAYVTSFPEVGAKFPVTTTGASNLDWFSTTELMILDEAAHVSLITLRPSASGVSIAGRRALFGGAVAPGPGSYSIEKKRALLAPLTGTAERKASLVVLTNWIQTLRRN